NTRIERLWCDYKQAVGMKWKEFFMELEANEGLDPERPSHIWLLHWLFLDAINQDIAEWVDAWNHHIISLHDGPNRSPVDLFLFGMIEDGPRGIAHLVGENEVDPDGLEGRVDNEELGEHDNNEDRNIIPRLNGPPVPAHLNEVICEVDDNIFDDGFIAQLD